jgi:hypothetical protein
MFNAWTNLSYRDETWAEFSTLNVGMLAHAVQLRSEELKQPNLKLKTRPKQLLGSRPLVFLLYDLFIFH